MPMCWCRLVMGVGMVGVSVVHMILEAQLLPLCLNMWNAQIKYEKVFCYEALLLAFTNTMLRGIDI